MVEIHRVIEGRACSLYGASADLLVWCHGSELASRVLSEARLGEDDLILALGAPQHAERVERSKRVIQQLWGAHAGLGPYPFLDALSEFEFDRLFYPDYRDHVCHQLKVFLLGLMAYEGCAPLRTALDETLQLPAADARGAFAVRWLVTAVYHDIGYVLENEHAVESDGKGWRRTCADLNATLDAPLSRTRALAEQISAEIERRVANDLQIFRLRVASPADIEREADFDLCELLRPEGEQAGLTAAGEPKPPHRRYYDYALAHAPAGRPRFRDHGIASALLLLRTWRAWADYVRRLQPHFGVALLHDARDQLDAVAAAIATLGETVRAAAGAMALHNVNPTIWNREDALAHGLTLSRFRIRLVDREHGRHSPLAFALGLVDSLQDWDRPRFRAGGAIRLDQDLSIRATGDRLALHVFRDAEVYRDPAHHPDSGFSKALAAMKEYLDPEAVDALVAWGEPPAEPSTAAGAAPAAPAHPDDDFVGRDFVFAAIERFLVPPTPCGYFTVIGAPGMGKSALFAELVRRTGCVHHANDRLQGVTSAAQFLASVCAQLIQTYRLPHRLPAAPMTDGELLGQLLTAASAALPAGRRLIIAIDALDEADPPDPRSGANLMFLPPRLPPGVFFVMTRRPMDLPLVAHVPQDRLVLEDFARENARDAETYLRRAAARPELAAWIAERAPGGAGAPVDAFVRILLDRSESNFMYLRYVLPDIARGKYRDLAWSELPLGLEGYYEDHWRRMGMTARLLPRDKLTVLYVLSAVRHPVSARLIADLSGVDVLAVHPILGEWRPFLHEQRRAGTTYHSLYHGSFRDFLWRRDVLQAAAVDLAQLHGRIADRLLEDVLG